MKSGKVWCLALGVFLGASLNSVARGQSSNDPQSSPAGSTNAQAQDQRAEVLYSPNGQNAAGQAGSNQPQHQAGQTQSILLQDLYTQLQPLNVVFDKGQGGLLLSTGKEGWWQDPGSQFEPNLTAADDSVREHLHLPKGQGVVVNAVVPNSGAAQVGIQQNDILLMLGESPLGKPQDLYDRLKQAGEKPVSLTLLRAGSRITLMVQPLIRVSLTPVAATAPAREYWIGISVTPLEPVLRAQLRLSPNHKVLVNEVVPESPAAKAGIARHDIIVALDGKPVSELSDVAKSVQAKGEKPLMLEIIGKGGKSHTVAVTPERKKATEVSQSGTFFVPDAPVNYSVNLVRTGAILDLPSLPVPLIQDWNQKSQEAGPALTGRLDALDSELKELQRLVQALEATAAKIVAREKAEAQSTTNEKDQPK